MTGVMAAGFAIGHPAVFYYGVAFAVLGIVALIALAPDARPVTTTSAASPREGRRCCAAHS